jgi:16S rRNA (uracil1498-N3)-methyltransferase
MSIPYFFEPQLIAGTSHFNLSEQSAKHCVQVLRMKEGDRLDLTNGQGLLAEATLMSASKKNASVTIINEILTPAPAQKIILGISLLKNAVRLEWLFEKATEMGIYSLVPLVCERTIHERYKMERMQNIVQSAMIQSKQTYLPHLHAPLNFTDFLVQHESSTAIKFIAHCEPGEKKSIKEISPTDDCILLIGPEGDFAPIEIEKAVTQNYTPIHLGNTRLRTETAGIFALSVLKKF